MKKANIKRLSRALNQLGKVTDTLESLIENEEDDTCPQVSEIIDAHQHLVSVSDDLEQLEQDLKEENNA